MADRELLFLLKMRNETDRVLREARADLRRTGREADNVSRTTQRGFAATRRELGAVALAARSFAGALAAVGAVRFSTAAVQQTLNFEAALTNVRRTTGLAGTELEELGDRIEEISVATGQGAPQLLAIAQAAGQLGVRGVDNLEAFTETIAKLGVATDVQGEGAALAIQRVLEVTGEGAEGVDEFGDVLANLGNQFAATESDILNVTTRIAGVGAQFGITSEQALAVGTALRSVGIEAEAGSTQIGQAFSAISAALREGGDELKVLTDLTGQTREQLQEAFAEDAVGVLNDFVEGLGRVQSAGGDVIPFLEALGLNGVRAERVFGTLATRSELLSQTLEAAGQSAGALDREFSIFSEGAGQQLAQLGQELRSVQRDIGDELLPTILEVGQELRDALNNPDIREGIQALAEGLALIASEAGEAVGQVLRIVEALNRLSDLDVSGVADAVAAIGEASPIGQARDATVAWARELLGVEDALIRIGGTQDENAERAEVNLEEQLAQLEANRQAIIDQVGEQEEYTGRVRLSLQVIDEQIERLRTMIGVQQALNAEVAAEGQARIVANASAASALAGLNTARSLSNVPRTAPTGTAGAGIETPEVPETPSTGGGGRRATPVADIIGRLDEEVRLLQVAEDQRERLRTQIDLENAAKQRGRDLTAEEQRQVEELLAARESAREAEKLEQFNDQLAQSVAQIDLQIELLGQNEEARRRIVAVTRLVQEATEAGFNEEQIANFTATLEGAFDRLEAAEAAFRADAFGGIKDALQEYQREADNLRDAFGDLTDNALSEFEDSLVRAAETGEISFSNMADSIISDLNRIAAQQVTKELSNQLFGIAGQLAGAPGGGGGGGFLGGILGGGGGGGLGSIFSGITGLFGFSEGGTTNGIAPPVHAGIAPTSAFRGAPRFQMGGLTGGIPAVLHRDEAVVPLSGGRSIPVEMTGGGSQDNRRPINITMNVTTPDVDAFRRSEGQIAADLGRQVERATRRNN